MNKDYNEALDALVEAYLAYKQAKVEYLTARGEWLACSVSRAMLRGKGYSKAMKLATDTHRAYKQAKQRVNDCAVAALREKYVYPNTDDMKANWKELGLEE